MAEAAIRFCQRTMAFAVLMIFICSGLSSSGALAQKGKAAEVALEAFDHNNFDNSANVDNKWFPLQPGTQLVYKGFTQEDEKRVPARVVQTVTDLTKVVNGVPTVVVWDVDHKDGKVTESEIVFFAQDKDGNVWLLGELVEIYEDGDFKGGSAWIGGMGGSSPGIMMKADPRPGTPSYSQGYAPPPFNWTDRATHPRCIGQGPRRGPGDREARLPLWSHAARRTDEGCDKCKSPVSIRPALQGRAGQASDWSR